MQSFKFRQLARYAKSKADYMKLSGGFQISEALLDTTQAIKEVSVFIGNQNLEQQHTLV